MWRRHTQGREDGLGHKTRICELQVPRKTSWQTMASSFTLFCLPYTARGVRRRRYDLFMMQYLLSTALLPFDKH